MFKIILLSLIADAAKSLKSSLSYERRYPNIALATAAWPLMPNGRILVALIDGTQAECRKAIYAHAGFEV